MADYYDTSALAKLVLEEAETAALRKWIAGRHDAKAVTSDLTRTELMRAVRRVDPAGLTRVREVLDAVTITEIPSGIFLAAGRLEPVGMRSLDAIHLAAALDLADDLVTFVCYDSRLLDAAVQHGVDVAHPGMSRDRSGSG